MSENVVTLHPQTVDRECRECGAPFTVKLPDGDSWIAKKVRVLAQVCDACIDAAEKARLDREATEALDRRRGAADVPSEFAYADLAKLEVGYNSAAHGAAARWAAGEIRGLVLTGDNGVGKSTLAAAAVNRRLRDRGARWVSVASLVAQSFGDDKAKAAVAATLTGRGDVVLDDIDKVKAGEWVSSQLFAAIDNRVSRGAGLIVTTNLPLDQLAKKFEGEFATAIGSRLAGYCEVHEMRGPDRRLGS